MSIGASAGADYVGSRRRGSSRVGQRDLEVLGHPREALLRELDIRLLAVTKPTVDVQTDGVGSSRSPSYSGASYADSRWHSPAGACGSAAASVKGTERGHRSCLSGLGLVRQGEFSPARHHRGNNRVADAATGAGVDGHRTEGPISPSCLAFVRATYQTETRRRSGHCSPPGGHDERARDSAWYDRDRGQVRSAVQPSPAPQSPSFGALVEPPDCLLRCRARNLGLASVPSQWLCTDPGHRRAARTPCRTTARGSARRS
jgi:hypothetical protein